MIVMAERIATRSHNKAVKPRPCHRFENHVGTEALPVSAFAWGDGSHGDGTGPRRRRAICEDCRAREAAEKAQRRAEWQSTFEDPVTGRMMRRCSTCRVTQDLEDDYYVEHRNPDGSIKGRAYICKKCSVERTNAIRKRRLRDPSTAVETRRQQRLWQKQWRQRNREAYRASQRRYMQRIREDPVRWARYLETQRIQHALRRERQTGRLPKTLPGAVKLRPPEPDMPYMPAEPLLRAIEKWLRRTERFAYLADCGVDERTLRRWREDLDEGLTPMVQFNAADRALSAIGLHMWDVWPEDNFRDLWDLIHERLEAA